MPSIDAPEWLARAEDGKRFDFNYEDRALKGSTRAPEGTRAGRSIVVRVQD